jgi:hypothetical protein
VGNTRRDDEAERPQKSSIAPVVRRLLAAALGGMGLAVFYRRLRRRPGSDPAVDLRRKLAESRVPAGERDEFEERETPVDEVDAPADLAARRRQVHDRGHAALDDMRGD